LHKLNAVCILFLCFVDFLKLLSIYEPGRVVNMLAYCLLFIGAIKKIIFKMFAHLMSILKTLENLNKATNSQTIVYITMFDLRIQLKLIQFVCIKILNFFHINFVIFVCISK